MKKHFLITLLAMFIGAFALINMTKTTNKEIDTKEHIYSDEIIPTTKNLILKTEEKEPELYDINQMYFENIHYLAEYLTFGEIDEVKLKIQAYIRSNINENILDCFIDIASIKRGEEGVFFECKIPNAMEITVEVKGGEGQGVNVEIKEKI
jgi:hypothetical protein